MPRDAQQLHRSCLSFKFENEERMGAVQCLLLSLTEALEEDNGTK